MIRDAEKKRLKHAKRIAELEKKAPNFMIRLQKTLTKGRLKQLTEENSTLNQI